MVGTTVSFRGWVINRFRPNVIFPCLASMIAMLVIGVLLLPVIVFWEFKFAKRPILARRLLLNRAVVFAAWIGFFDFVSLYMNVNAPFHLDLTCLLA